MDICPAMAATAIGRSGLMPLCSAISAMIGNMVYTMWPVPHRNVRVQVVSGASSVMCEGCLRNSLSANCIITFKPPAVCSVAAQPITARMVSMTRTGGSPGGRPNTNTSTNRPMPLMRPSPMPPKRLPTSKQPNTAVNSSKIIDALLESRSGSAESRFCQHQIDNGQHQQYGHFIQQTQRAR